MIITVMIPCGQCILVTCREVWGGEGGRGGGGGGGRKGGGGGGREKGREGDWSSKQHSKLNKHSMIYSQISLRHTYY